MLDVGLQVQNKQPQQVFFIKLKLSKKWDGTSDVKWYRKKLGLLKYKFGLKNKCVL